MKSKIQKIPSWLPVFSGFYGTCWNPDDDIREHLREDRPDLRQRDGDWKTEWPWWDNFDNERYENDVARACCEVIHGWLPKESGIVLSLSGLPLAGPEIEVRLGRGAGVHAVEFERVVSPKEYNFANDAVNVTYVVNAGRFARWFNRVLKDNPGEFEAYLLRYKSRDGFISYYPHDIATWREWTKDFSDIAPEIQGYLGRRFDGHCLGSLLQFYFQLPSVIKKLSPGYQDCELTLWETVREQIYVPDYLNLPELNQVTA